MDDREQDLVRAAREGDVVAFRALFDETHARVLALAVGMTGSRDEAMDVAQEAFIRAWERLPTFEGESSFSTWVHRIAVNASIDHLRRERRRASRAADDVDPDATPDDGRGDPERASRSREIARRVRRDLDTLTPEHKAAIVLREINGLSYDEMSRVMGCSKGTVMSRLHYARQKLREKLEDLRP